VLRLTAVALRHPGAEAECPVIAAFGQAIVRPEHEFAFPGDWARNTQRRYLASHEDGSAGSYSRPSHPHRLLSERKVKQSMPVIGMPVTKLSNRGLAQTIGPAGYLTMYLQFRHNLASWVTGILLRFPQAQLTKYQQLASTILMEVGKGSTLVDAALRCKHSHPWWIRFNAAAAPHALDCPAVVSTVLTVIYVYYPHQSFLWWPVEACVVSVTTGGAAGGGIASEMATGGGPNSSSSERSRACSSPHVPTSESTVPDLPDIAIDIRSSDGAVVWQSGAAWADDIPIRPAARITSFIYEFPSKPYMRWHR